MTEQALRVATHQHPLRAVVRSQTYRLLTQGVSILAEALRVATHPHPLRAVVRHQLALLADSLCRIASSYS